MTDHNPNGNALGPGYTGTCGDRESGDRLPPRWVTEEIDLSPYAGQSVRLRFDLVTDDAINHPGLCLDDISVPEIGWEDNVESGEAGWQAAGFVRTENRIPQRWIIQTVEYAGKPRVRRLMLEGARGAWQFQGLGEETDRITLVIAALAPYTAERATYSLRIEQLAQPGS